MTAETYPDGSFRFVLIEIEGPIFPSHVNDNEAPRMLLIAVMQSICHKGTPTAHESAHCLEHWWEGVCCSAPPPDKST